MAITQTWWKGLVAGAAGTVTLDTVTYLDMALRGRPASTTPETTVGKVESLTGLALSSDGPNSDTAANRRSGLGALLGMATGLATDFVYGLVRPRTRQVPLLASAVVAAVGVNAGAVVPMAALGVTDPRSWPASSWLMDIVPHLAYGVVTAAVFDGIAPPPPTRRTLRLLRG